MTNISEMLMAKKGEINEVDYEESTAYNAAVEIFEQLNELQEYYDELRHAQSNADQKISDIHHFIEISDNLNAADGYNMYKMLREVLRERREIKDQVAEMRPVMESINPERILKSEKSVVNNIRKQHSNRENRTYRTRVMKEVFGKRIE